MAVLDKLVLCPLLDSYQVALGDDVITTQYTSGMPRQRLAGIGQPHETSVTFRHKAVHQDYILAFWRINRARRFSMRLIADGSEMAWYECNFIGKPTISSLGNNVFEFSVGLIVKPNRIDLDVDRAFIDLYIETNGDISLFGSLLEKLVNFDLPDAVRGVYARL